MQRNKLHLKYTPPRPPRGLCVLRRIHALVFGDATEEGEPHEVSITGRSRLHAPVLTLRVTPRMRSRDARAQGGGQKAHAALFFPASPSVSPQSFTK